METFLKREGYSSYDLYRFAITRWHDLTNELLIMYSFSTCYFPVNEARNQTLLFLALLSWLLFHPFEKPSFFLLQF